MADVVVVGAGPVGVLLSGELARHGVDAVVLERSTSVRGGTRAIGVHAAALCALEPSGVTERILARALRVSGGEARAAGKKLGILRFAGARSRHPYVATLPQAETEIALAEAARDAGASPVRRNSTVRAVAAHGTGVEVRYLHGQREESMRAKLAVIAAGARGRSLAGSVFDVIPRHYPDSYLMSDAPDPGVEGPRAVVYLDRLGVLESFPLPGGMRRYVAWDRFGWSTDTLSRPDPDPDPDPARGGREERTETMTGGEFTGVPEAEDGALRDRLRTAVAERGAPVNAALAIVSATTFGVRRTLAPRMRASRVFVIGDAAHEVSPIGGQGMNLGLLDAVTLAPLLARWLRDGEPPEDGLHRWEENRLRAAMRSARIAAVNTVAGRPRGALGHAFRRGFVTTALRPPAHDIFARAYSMGFDPGV